MSSVNIDRAIATGVLASGLALTVYYRKGITNGINGINGITSGITSGITTCVTDGIKKVYKSLRYDKWAVTYRVVESVDNITRDRRVMLVTLMPSTIPYNEEVRKELIKLFQKTFKTEVDPIVERVVKIDGNVELMKIKKYAFKSGDNLQIVGFEYSPSVNDIKEVLDGNMPANLEVIPLD
jgi:hypothetical protein